MSGWSRVAHECVVDDRCKSAARVTPLAAAGLNRTLGGRAKPGLPQEGDFGLGAFSLEQGTRGIQASLGIRSRRGDRGRFDEREAAEAGRAARAGFALRKRERGSAPARAGKAPGPRAHREAARPRLVLRARPLRQAPRVQLRNARAPSLRRRGSHGLWDDLRPQGLRVFAGLHRLRRIAERGLRGEDLQGHGSGREVRLPADRDQRLGGAPGSRRASSHSPATPRSSGGTSSARA